MASPLQKVRMYSRKTCGLCDQAREIVLGVQSEVPFEFEEVLIDGDPRLERDYGLRVPVVDVAGREEFEVIVDPERLRELVAGGA